jgi:heme ABC exporter, ATP-binding protein CcmA
MQAIARELTGRRGETILFSGVSFALAAGEGLVVSGPNGVGKSTLLRILCGLLPAEAGTFGILGADGIPIAVAEAAHYLGHRNAMKRDLTVAENLGFWKAFQSGESGEGLSVAEAIEAVELHGVAHLPFGYLSAGQQRRIALARLLLVRRPLWILDEPTAALDRRSDRLFSDLAAAHLQEGGMMIAATHLPIEIANVKPLELVAHRAADEDQEVFA